MKDTGATENLRLVQSSWRYRADVQDLWESLTARDSLESRLIRAWPDTGLLRALSGPCTVAGTANYPLQDGEVQKLSEKLEHRACYRRHVTVFLISFGFTQNILSWWNIDIITVNRQSAAKRQYSVSLELTWHHRPRTRNVPGLQILDLKWCTPAFQNARALSTWRYC